MRFLVDMYLPRVAADEAAAQATRLREAAARLTRRGRPVRYVRTVSLPADESCLHLLEAPDAATAAETVNRARLGGARISDAVELGAAREGGSP